MSPSFGLYFSGTAGTLKFFLSELIKHYGNIEIRNLPVIRLDRYDEIRRQADWMYEELDQKFTRRTQPLTDEQFKNSRESMDADEKERTRKHWEGLSKN